jgi:CBS domain-containing protein
LFNLIPGFPLDGGRVLRSIIWEANKNMAKSTNIAAMVGRYFGWAFIAYGAYNLLGGNVFYGIWIAFIGWFLSSAADTSRFEVLLREHLSGVQVKEVMNTSPVTIKPGTTVESVINDAFLQCHCRAVPVSNDHRPIGIVTLDDVKKVHKDKWAYTSAEQIMTREPLYSVSPEDDLNTVMRLLAEHNLNQLLVLKDGELMGMVYRADVIRHFEISRELGMQRKQKSV